MPTVAVDPMSAGVVASTSAVKVEFISIQVEFIWAVTVVDHTKVDSDIPMP